ncbi:D-aminopeptidase [Microtetraspora sp. NBRC 13810]|uniref:DmpA family aminopeptidase n=1 Tax=Microtetraspora sp. NBRC 13810 TaxID=3030990 RepID=UPI0024A320B7|nr:P1 family peptidase [Microtetraspora sp. NBRC 13810]GLW12593.1 D-aminopeptidase [Microtetraspora sp. NBRC 13810]
MTHDAPARRARDFGIVIGTGRPGPHNAITDVPGVMVGHTTLISGDGPLRTGHGPVRTGVTVIRPRPGHLWQNPVFAGYHRLNGAGELTGTHWIAETGRLTTALGLTNTHSVGVVHDALIAAEVRDRDLSEAFFSLPVVGETWDGVLNDVNGFHVTAAHVLRAYDEAAGGPVPEGNVGGGTGMICHDFKGGVGTASRVTGGHTVGVLVQANHGRRERLTVQGVPVGRLLGPDQVPVPRAPEILGTPRQGEGSIIVVVATDAPLLPHQLTRLAQRAGLGVARLGGVGEHLSGDLFIAFATGNALQPTDFGPGVPLSQIVTMLADAHITPLFDAVVEATEEAILNALVTAGTMTGRDDITVHALDGHRLRALLP